MTTMVEALSFLGPCGPVARDANSCIYYDSKHAAGVCLGTIQARTHVQLAHACQRSMLCTQHRLRLNMHATRVRTLGIWVMNVPIMPLHLVHLASSPVTTLPLSGFVIPLTHLPVVMVVTASARFWKDCIIRNVATSGWELVLCSSSGSLCLSHMQLCHLWSCSQQFFTRIHFAPQEKQWKAQLRLSLPRQVLVIVSHNMWNPLLKL